MRSSAAAASANCSAISSTMTAAPIETALSDRTLALGRDDLKGRRIVAVAGGKIRCRPSGRCWKAGCLSGLITDERDRAGRSLARKAGRVAGKAWKHESIPSRRRRNHA